jgi:hypothetical protein
MSAIDLIDIDSEEVEIIQEINRTSFAYKWTPLDIRTIAPANQDIAHRLNALGDNFYFIKAILRKHRLSNQFHRQYCNELMCWSLKEVFEVPRDHFKTTIGLGMAMWWALPFTDRDEMFMRALGYTDEWILWMKRAHDQNTRTLIAMEVIKNAWKVGKKISGEYKNNDFFKKLFPEIIPDSSCQWSADTMTHKRDFTRGDANQGEGTYEFTGVDAALQSKHYKRLIFDDLFGKDALKSELVANSTWEWFQLAVGAFDSDISDPDAEPDELVNGNRWSFHDLNWKIRKELPYFKFHTHDAEGGCCNLHPAGTPIFPEEWSSKKLARMRNRLGEYFYSCQFRNKPIPPGGNVFKSEWLRYFVFKTIDIENVTPGFKTVELNAPMDDLGTFGTQTFKIIPANTYDHKRHKAIRHETHQGILPKDIPTSYLSKMLLVDPNHAGEKGRANNVVMVLGVNYDPLNIYILDGFANNCSREDAVHQMYKLGEAWRIRTIWVETSAGQTWLKTLLQLEDGHRKSLGKWYFHEVKNFKDNRSENAKSDRIEDTEPYFRRGQIWINTHENSEFTSKFLEEYNDYPHAATKDILDTLGHGVQNMQHSTMSEKEARNFKYKQEQRMQKLQTSRSMITGY